MLTAKLYKWHRTASLVIAVPVLLWAASGFLHPVMTNIRPAVATQSMPVIPVDTGRIRTPLNQALALNGIDSIRSFRLVHIDTSCFYQVCGMDSRLQYLSAATGKKLNKGDWLYAQYLARIFLEGSLARKSPGQSAITVSADCCDAAANCVLKGAGGAAVDDIQYLDHYDNEYKSINRLLPVYKVSFKRKDGIRIYVETGQDRFSFATDNRRAAFTALFAALHTWDWGERLGVIKTLAQMFFVGLAFLTSLAGIFLFFKVKKRAGTNTTLKARRLHRGVSICVVLFTLMFTFSGFYHAFSKLKKDTRGESVYQQAFDSQALAFDLSQLQRAVGRPLTNLSPVMMNDTLFWRVTQLQTAGAKSRSGDLMKDMSAPRASVSFVNAATNSVFPHGDEQYARFLSRQYSGRPEQAIVYDSAVTRFNDEYNFADKRLPVWKVGYNSSGHERYYVETATGQLSKKVKDADMYEGYSFALLHKHHFMDFAGKGWRDASTMFWAAAQIFMIGIGLRLYFLYRKRRV